MTGEAWASVLRRQGAICASLGSPMYGELLARIAADVESGGQTNEVGRSAALIGALLILVQRFPYPVRLFEIGASAGLNLRADHFRYRHQGGEWGPQRSPVIIDDACGVSGRRTAPCGLWSGMVSISPRSMCAPPTAG